MNARDDKQRQFAYRAAVAESVAKIGKDLGSVIGKDSVLLCPLCTNTTVYCIHTNTLLAEYICLIYYTGSTVYY